jgi:methionyl aminopeptidase
MSITTETDWKGLKAAGHVVKVTLDALERHVRAGVTTAELDRIAAGVFAAHGARSAPAIVYGFPATVLISIDDEVVHGVPGSRVIERGSLVKLDVTVEKDGYMTDAARTVLVGRGSELARRLRACARAAFERALGIARAGVLVRDVGRAISDEVTRAGFSVIPELSGHGIGRTIHEPPSVPNYADPHLNDVLTEGLVVTIEPLICSGSGAVVEGSDKWTIRTSDGSLAAHHEHTLVITRSHPVLLTAA